MTWSTKWWSVLALFAACHAGLAASVCSAGWFPSHAVVGNSVGNDNMPMQWEHLVGDGDLDTEWDTYRSVMGNFSTARAATSIFAKDLLRVYAEVGGPDWAVTAVAAWRDVTYADSVLPSESLRVSFQFHAYLGTALDDPNSTRNSAGAGILVAALAGRENAAAVFDVYETGVFRSGPGLTLSQIGPEPQHLQLRDLFDETWFESGEFVGTFHIDVPYDEAVHGYPWVLGLQADVGAIGGYAVVDGLRTMSLTSVTLTDGSPVNATFESGLTLSRTSAVPEPSSLALMGIGVFGLASRLIRRRQRHDSVVA